MDHVVGVLVPVVLVGDVDVGTGVDVVTDVDLVVADDVAPPSDHAPVTDADHRVGDHGLPRDHAGRDAHVGSDQGVAADGDPPLAEDGPRREGQAAAGAERAEAGPEPVVGTDGAVPGQPVPAGVDGGAGPPAPARGRVVRG
jgi:hypothetical protein